MIKKIRLSIKGSIHNGKTIIRYYLIIGFKPIEISVLQFSKANARKQVYNKLENSRAYQEYLIKRRELQELYNIPEKATVAFPDKRSKRTYKNRGKTLCGTEREKAYQREYRREYRKNGGTVPQTFKKKLRIILNTRGREVKEDNAFFRGKKRKEDERLINNNQ